MHGLCGSSVHLSLSVDIFLLASIFLSSPVKYFTLTERNSRLWKLEWNSFLSNQPFAVGSRYRSPLPPTSSCANVPAHPPSLPAARARLTGLRMEVITRDCYPIKGRELSRTWAIASAIMSGRRKRVSGAARQRALVSSMCWRRTLSQLLSPESRTTFLRRYPGKGRVVTSLSTSLRQAITLVQMPRQVSRVLSKLSKTSSLRG